MVYFLLLCLSRQNLGTYKLYSIIRGDTNDEDSRLIPLLRNQTEGRQSAASQPQFLDKMWFIWILILQMAAISSTVRHACGTHSYVPLESLLQFIFTKRHSRMLYGVLFLTRPRLILPRWKVMKKKHWMLKSHTQPKIPGLREFDVSLFSSAVLCFGLSSNLA